jgi:mannose-6-phosphate isomerase-like protein (cupin superfamily)
MQHDLKRRRVKVNPRDLPKSSRIRAVAATSPIKVAGQREPTETGYRVPGYEGKTFETFFEVMLAGTASAFFLHEKKDRAVWLMAGQGFLTTETKEHGQKTRRLISGDSISLNRGTTYRFATTATEQLEFFVTQGVKYEATLQIIAPSDATRTASAEQLAEPTLDERVGTMTAQQSTRRRRSKAAQQQTQTRRRTSPQVEETFKIVPESGQATDPRSTGSGAGVNVQPSGGRFSDIGAG